MISASPHEWNSLPAFIRDISTYDCFKKHVKTYLFRIAIYDFYLLFTHFYKIFDTQLVICNNVSYSAHLNMIHANLHYINVLPVLLLLLLLLLLSSFLKVLLLSLWIFTQVSFHGEQLVLTSGRNLKLNCNKVSSFICKHL
jgi:hypothetical protein